MISLIASVGSRLKTDAQYPKALIYKALRELVICCNGHYSKGILS
jgi:hypothetical protein